MNTCTFSHFFGLSLFAAGIALLALHPVIWLIGTWFDPAYQSHGLLVAGLVAGLFVWSLHSPRKEPAYGAGKRALALLMLTAGTRLSGQVLGIHVIGALALVLDIYALGLLLGLGHRQRALAPAWLAVLFAFSLPLERIFQRTLGFGLQQLSALGACRLLSLGSEPVQCEGVRILLAGQDVLVDLPCAGTRGLLLLLMLFSALAALIRPKPMAALIGLGITLISVFAANIIRIALLALGLAYPQAFGHIAVMEAPWHEGIGLLTLALGATPILIWGQKGRHSATLPKFTGVVSLPQAHFPGRVYRHWSGFGLIVCAAIIISLPARPVDVSRKQQAIALPATIAGFTATQGKLSAQEQDYFTRYGGSAARAHYGPYGLLLVSTSAPLRHLHAPDECLTGSGHGVRYLGARFAPYPTALYRSIDPHGNVWRIAVTFISDRGELATSVTEAVWRWLQHPQSTWTMVQRIAPWNTTETSLDAWDMAVARALDLSYHATEEILQ